jgi:hypothetical protein
VVDETVGRLIRSDGLDHVEESSRGGETPVILEQAVSALTFLASGGESHDGDTRRWGVVPFGNKTAFDVL